MKTSPLWKLSRQARGSLAAAFEAKRLAPPYTSLSVQRYVGKALAEDVAAELERFSAAGMGPAQMGTMLRFLADEPAEEPRVDLVWTGPEEVGTASRDTGVVVRELFERAERSVLIAGFAIYQGKQVFEALANRMEERPELVVRMFLNIERRYEDNTTPAGELVKRFADKFRKDQWPGERLPEAYYDPRTLNLDKKKRTSLHAKCVVVDDRWALITSANFTEAAQERNIEAGVLIDDRALAGMLKGQFEGLVVGKRLVRVAGL